MTINYCEFCEVDFPDPRQMRKHILSIKHVRSKKSHELSQEKYVKTIRQANVKPRDFSDLIRILNIHCDRDVADLHEAGFFNIKSYKDAKLFEEMRQHLYNGIVDHHIDKLPPELRQPLKDLMDKKAGEMAKP